MYAKQTHRLSFLSITLLSLLDMTTLALAFSVHLIAYQEIEIKRKQESE